VVDLPEILVIQFVIFLLLKCSHMMISVGRNLHTLVGAGAGNFLFAERDHCARNVYEITDSFYPKGSVGRGHC
jgi:hypothetical protein